ncbi:hypothetical protein Godav_013359 [Gossypium davidsonii]|uniref:Uncharacterized protein n=3 Tax=Gossypium TaxID=3633 RepID=A0A7J8RHG6_GOSDV|nr:hypothetical protein [Gossypium davidsonii]
MFTGVVTTNDKAWAPSSSTLRSKFFEDVNNDIPKENEEENAINDVHISNDVHIDENSQKRNTSEISTSHFKTGRKKSSKQIGGAVRFLTPAMDPYSIPQAIKVLDNM